MSSVNNTKQMSLSPIVTTLSASMEMLMLMKMMPSLSVPELYLRRPS
jgi:hypothetical protein